MIDTSIVRVHPDAHALPVGLALTPGESHDNRRAGELLSRLAPGSTPLADRGYDADRIGELAMKKGASKAILRPALSAISFKTPL
jgi:transposase